MFAITSCNPRDLRPIHPCVTSTVSKRIAVTGVNEVDLLFVVDDSNSMAQEQAALRVQFPRIIEGLVTGDPDGDPSTPNFPEVASLRVAVVSTDLGVAGVGSQPGEVGIEGCIGLGDNGVFNRLPVGADAVSDPMRCDGDDADSDPDVLTGTTLPSFLTFDASGATTAEVFADRIGCYAVLGTGGCAFEQQLESMLKSLTPSSAEVRFLSHTGAVAGSELGQGDRANAGWLREEALLAVLMVTDEDDCSAKDRVVFDFGAEGAYEEGGVTFGSRGGTRCIRFGDEIVPGNPNGNQDLSLNTLFDPARYAEGLVALKGGDPNAVVFSLITGVPPATVDEPELGEGTENLDAILADERMAIAFRSRNGDDYARVAYSCTVCAFGFPSCPDGFNDVDGDGVDAKDCDDSVIPNGVCDPGEALHCTAEINGVPGCQIDETEVAATTAAVPPRRLVRTARALHEVGAHVIVQSICQADFSDAIVAILERISAGLATACVPRALVRNAEDRVACRVLETAPPGGTCAGTPGRTRVRDDADGLEVCEVEQLAVTADVVASGGVPDGAGWYYDDHTFRVDVCRASPTRQRVSFTDAGTPANGVRLSLECDQPVPGDLPGPDVGRPCSADASCAMTPDEIATFVVRYNLPTDHAGTSGPLVCDVGSRTCQMGCVSDADCPGGYTCYGEADARPFCVNPTCPAW